VDDHAPGKSSFGNWVTTVKYADWDTPENIRQTFGSADLLGQKSSQVVFNIGGNNYRMICKYHFGFPLFTCLYAGSAHMQNTMNSATMAGNIRLMSINSFEYEDLKIYHSKIGITVQYLLQNTGGFTRNQ
jgi:mRNA-degrading endonuclease HigB of HigAB toxin-antitoxin module